MNRIFTVLIVLIFGLSTQAFSQARVQVIHNSADAAAQVVDVWLDNTLLLDDFAFRTASPFVDAPAGVDFTVAIQPSNSTSPANPLWSQTYNLVDGETYILVANGIVSASGYNPVQPFDIYVYDMGREMATNMSNTDVLVFHGSTDAPVVDVFEATAGQLIDNLVYGDFVGYLELPTADYSLQVRNEAGTDVVAQYGAPLQTLGLDGQAISVYASGFLNPANNSVGPAFGLWVALASGGPLVELPSEPISTARVQVIHNSADAAAAVVDVWLDNTLLLDDFAFRTASPFIDAPAGVNFTVAIQPSNSTSPANPLWSQTYNLAGNGKYILVANGIVNASGYNPIQPFNVFVYDMGREVASNMSNTDVLVFHGSTDAPVVDIVEVTAGQLVDNLAYSDFAGYLELPTANYSLQVRNEAGTDVVAQFGAPLQTLGLNGQAISVYASGFLNPANNNSGAAFGLWVALASGGPLVELPSEPISTVRVQVIHNSADAAAAVVDVWLDNTLLLDDFAFRTASPFIDAPAGEYFTIAIKPSNSTSPDNPLWSQAYNLNSNNRYVMVARGIISASGYTPAEPFGISFYTAGREAASNMTNTDLLVFHGSTDAPTVDIFEVSAGQLVDDLSYGSFAGYLELPTADYSIQLRSEAGTDVIAQYGAPLQTLGLDGQPISVLASGFLNPANNSGGPDFGLWVALTSGGPLVELPAEPVSTARVQVIHNSADAAAEVVDVWLNETLLIDDFMFRTATPFIDAPANEEFTISIQPANSTSAMNALWSQNYTLDGNEKYILIANGIISPSGYDPVQPFDIYVNALSREAANGMDTTDVLVFHGSTDAPIVDIYETGVGAGLLIDDLMYGDYAGYLELQTADYILEVRDETGTQTVAAYEAPLATLGLNGAAISVVASGFLTPANNSNGPAFGLWVALADGGQLIELPSASTSPTARVQVVHNSADAAAAVVDVWLDNMLLIDDFAFRTASPFIDAPAGVDFTIAIQPSNSTSPANPLWSQTYNLAADETYILVANGIVSASGYDPIQPFDIYVYDMGREMATSMSNTDVLVFHGSTDAPVVDIFEVTAGQLVDNLAYGEFAGYLELPTADYSIQVRNEAGTDVVAQYGAPLQTLGLDGEAITVYASGFLNPGNNSGGAAFGLWVSLEAGGELVELPTEPISTARVQVIHNSADAAAETVDVWLNETLLIDDFMFRTATPFIDAPANEEFTIAIQPANSTSPMNPLWSQTYTLDGNEKYILIANGIVSPSGYEPIQPFDIYVNAISREVATSMDNTDVLVFHGSTDAPTVDIYETGVGAGLLIDDLMYEEYEGYLELPTADYILEVRDETGTQTVAAYDAPLATLGLDGAAISVIASGFLTPANNSNGPAFGLWVALASGGDLIPLSFPTAVEEQPALNEDEIMIYPNPARDMVNVNYGLETDQNVSIEIYNLLGNKVFAQEFGFQRASIHNEQINISGLSNGLYFLRIIAGNAQITQKLKVNQ